MPLSSDQSHGLYTVASHAFEILRDSRIQKLALGRRVRAFSLRRKSCFLKASTTCCGQFLLLLSASSSAVCLTYIDCFQSHQGQTKNGMFQFSFMLSYFLLRL